MQLKECYDKFGGSYEDAFKAAHTMKGVSRNLGFKDFKSCLHRCVLIMIRQPVQFACYRKNK